MNPQTQFCHNPDCCTRDQVGQGNIRVHRRREQRYQCTTRRRTFVATTSTPCSRVRTAADVVTLVLTWPRHGRPLEAIVAAFGLDELTVVAWLTSAGQHVHQHVVELGQVGKRYARRRMVFFQAFYNVARPHMST